MGTPKTWLDMNHVGPMQKIYDAYVAFDKAVNDAHPYMWIEVPEVIVVDEAGMEYARVYRYDGEILIEPKFNLIRKIEDR